MKKIIASVSIVSIVSMFVATFALAATTGQVTATVTASVIAVTVGDGAVAYGVVATNKDTTASGVNDTQTITNTGTVTEDFSVKGNSSASWTLGASAGDAIYAHKTCITTCDATPTWTAMGLTYTSLAASKAPAGTTDMDLQITVPTANPTVTQQSVPVDVLATLH